MTDTTRWKVHPDAPTDDEDHPIHPEKGYRICGRSKSENTTPTEHGRERDDYPFCLQRAGWGLGPDVDKGACKNHGGAGGGPEGEQNGNFKHGAYSEHFKSDLTEREQDAFDDLVTAFQDDAQTLDVLRETAAELVLKYKRSGEPRFIREARQLLSEFNVIDNTDHQEVNVLGDGVTVEFGAGSDEDD